MRSYYMHMYTYIYIYIYVRIYVYTHTQVRSHKIFINFTVTRAHGWNRKPPAQVQVQARGACMEPQSPTPSPGAQSKITQARGAPKVTGHPYVYAFILLNTLDTNVSLFSYGYSAV